jgi:ribosomal protein S18 acetylase RimI-like enzyme
MTEGEIVGGTMTCDGISGGEIVGSVMAGYEGHRGWINYLAVAPRFRKQGHGRQLMEAAETLLRARGCPKINLQVRASNTEVIRFYEAIGFVVDDVVSFGKRLEHDLPPSG